MKRGMLQWPEEIEPFLAWLKARDPQVILEIGTGPGGLTGAFCGVAARVISIDLPAGSSSGMSLPEAIRRNLDLESSCPGFTGILGDSHAAQTLDQVRRLLGGPIVDLLFIDGDHRYAGVSLDYRSYGPLVKPGGAIALHDIHAYGYGDEVAVHRFWEELPGQKLEWSVRGGWGGIGVVLV